MPTAYAQWIAQYAKEHNGDVLGRCRDACTKMHAAFHELRIVKGHVYVMNWGKRGHWWLLTPSGGIVDPTEAQFPPIFEYEEWAPGTPVRIGKCMECGNDIWWPCDSLDEQPPTRSTCSKVCEAALARAFA